MAGKELKTKNRYLQIKAAVKVNIEVLKFLLGTWGGYYRQTNYFKVGRWISEQT